MLSLKAMGIGMHRGIPPFPLLAREQLPLDISGNPLGLQLPNECPQILWFNYILAEDRHQSGPGAYELNGA